MNNMRTIEDFVFEKYTELDFEQCLNYFLLTLGGTFGLLYIYKDPIFKILTIVLSSVCLFYYLYMMLSKEKRRLPINGILTKSIFLFSLTWHMVCFSMSAITNLEGILVILLAIAFIFCLGFVYIGVSKKRLYIPKKSYDPSRSKLYAGIGALAGIGFMKYYIKPKYSPISKEQDLVFISIFLLIGSLYTDLCFVGFLKAYYIKKNNLSPYKLD